MKFSKILLTIPMLLLSFIGKGQEMLGISNSNFAGNMGMALNPSLFIGSPYIQEFNFISADFFIDNDYVYLKKRTSLFAKSLRGESIPEENILDYYDGKKKRAFGNVFLRGPSMIQNRERFSWGFHTALRSNLSAINVPTHLAKFMKEGFDYIPQHDEIYLAEPMRAAGMFWGELGGTFGKKLIDRRDKGYLAAAVTLKLIAGFDAVYANFENFDYEVPSSDTLIVNNVNAEYGHALYGGDPAFKKPFKIRGYGAGLDLGITYYKGRVHGANDCNETAEKYKKYKYRLGVSLIDIGMVHFGKEASVFKFDDASTVWPGIDTLKFNSITEQDIAISNQFLNDPGKSRVKNKFNIFLPTAFSIQFDYAIVPKVYLNASIIQAVPLSKYAIVRASQAAVTARYETRKFEVAVPFVMYEYKTPHLGLAFRYRFFVIGTDRLGSFTGLFDTTGFDLFFGFKANLCEFAKKGGKKPFCPVN
ncbi:MAG: hypothetical protein JNL49_07030 [Bacteroidia bacterium]|nr:hypothetical protein [Bacteroidia bacterium]